MTADERIDLLYDFETKRRRWRLWLRQPVKLDWLYYFGLATGVLLVLVWFRIIVWGVYLIWGKG